MQETADAVSRTTSYNAASQVLTSTNAEGHISSSVYDARNRRTSTTDANSLTTAYTYDANNNLLTLTDPKSNVRSWVYDNRNLNTRKNYPGAATDRLLYEYDSLGRMTKKTDQLSDNCSFVFDLAGRMTSKIYKRENGTTESTDTFAYDAASRLTQTVKGRHSITTNHTYAADSMPLTESFVADSRTYALSRTYDPANRPLTQVFPNNKATTWAYDTRNLVSTVHYDGALVTTLTHDTGYRLTMQANANNTMRNITYERMDNLRTSDTTTKGGSNLADLNMSYSYAADKQITAETLGSQHVLNASFVANYDAGNRLTNWTRPNYPAQTPGNTAAAGAAGGNAAQANAQTWTFDNAGNWTSTSINGNAQARSYDVADQLTNIAGNASVKDLKGNLTEVELYSKDYEMAYDLDNCLRSSSALRYVSLLLRKDGQGWQCIIKVEVDNDDVEYRYDALGRRVIRKEGSTKRAIVWWGNNEVGEYKHQAGQACVQNDIMSHPNALNSVIARAKDGSKHKLEWYHKNYLNHVMAVTKDNGDYLEHYRYNAYGEIVTFNASGTIITNTQINNRITWNTRRRDLLTGLYYYKYRWYAAPLGRWLGRDPIEEDGGINLYAFVGNDAVNRWDRLGREGESYNPENLFANSEDEPIIGAQIPDVELKPLDSALETYSQSMTKEKCTVLLQIDHGHLLSRYHFRKMHCARFGGVGCENISDERNEGFIAAGYGITGIPRTNNDTIGIGADHGNGGFGGGSLGYVLYMTAALDAVRTEASLLCVTNCCKEVSIKVVSTSSYQAFVRITNVDLANYYYYYEEKVQCRKTY